LDRWSLALCKCTRSRFCGKICEKPGNLITLPPLIIHREFEASAFTVVLGLSTAISGIACSFGPALLGLVRGLSGGYGRSASRCNWPRRRSCCGGERKYRQRARQSGRVSA